jgi:hypothetical protein
MKTYEQLTKEEQKLAFLFCVNEEIRILAEEGPDFFPKELIELRKETESAFQKAEDLQTPWFLNNILYSGGIKEAIDCIAEDECRSAKYTETTDGLIIQWHELEHFKRLLKNK